MVRFKTTKSNTLLAKHTIGMKMKTNISLIITCILIGACSAIYDIEGYSMSYYSSGFYEFGYTFVEQGFKKMGFSFDYFRLIIMSLSIFVMDSIISKQIKNRLGFYFLFLFFPLPFLAFAVRNTIGMAIMTLAIPLLMKKDKNRLVGYIILTIIAASFQRTMIFYLLFLLVYRYYHSRVFKPYLSLLGILTILTALFVSLSKTMIGNIFGYLASWLFEANIIENSQLKYFTVLGNWGFLLNLFCMLLFILLLFYCRRNLKSEVNNLKNSSLENRVYDMYNFVTYLLYCNMLLLILIPAIRSNSNYFRLFLNIVPLNYASILGTISCFPKNSKRKLFIGFSLVTVVLLSFMIFVWPERNEIFYVLFTNNWVMR